MGLPGIRRNVFQSTFANGEFGRLGGSRRSSEAGEKVRMMDVRLKHRTSNLCFTEKGEYRDVLGA